MRARLWLAVGLTWAVSTVGAGVLFSPAHADSSPATSTGDSSESWYNTSDATACSSPIGCPPVSLTSESYAANTLHVGVAHGSSSSVTYLMPDLSAYVGGTLPTAGTMTLPLATVSNNGNSNPSTATIEACLSKAVFKDGTAGSTSTPPATDCSVTSKLVYANSAFTFDLSPFLAKWSQGTPQDGIALMPVLTGTNILTNWQVAFNGRNLQGATPISSALSGGTVSQSSDLNVAPPVTTGDQSASAVDSTPLPDNSSTAPVVEPSSPAVSSSPALSPTPAATTPATTPSTAPAAPETAPIDSSQSSGGSSGFQYPEVLLLPLLIAGGMLFVLRLLTSDATPKRLRGRPIQKEA